MPSIIFTLVSTPRVRCCRGGAYDSPGREERMRMPRSTRSAAALAAALLLGLVPSAAAQAAPGDLDPTFSGDGKQTTDFGQFRDGAGGVALQGDGKIVAVGGTGGGDFALARYDATGSLDPSFSGDGKQTTDFGGGPAAGDAAAAVALAPGGKIVAVGYFRRCCFAVARYKPNGSLDPTFSGDGKQTTNFGGTASAVAIQRDGKIVVAGYAGGRGFALARYNPNGSLDRSFSSDGKQTTDSGQVAYAVAIQPDGKIVVVGRGGVEGSNFALARYDPNGSLDTSFSGNGRQQTNFGGYDGARGVALQGDGKIVAVGFASLGGDFGLARYNPNGSLDTSFSGNGRQTTDFGGSTDGASGVAIEGDGKIVVVGCACPDDPNARDFALARYNPNGLLDTSFSGDGKETTDFGASEDIAGALALQTDGNIVAVGGGGPGGDFALARYLGG
jgi:uncharacterized delta-60 repeat protein